MYEGETVEGRVTVAARGISHTYTKLAELAFDSYRKCMSVIVKVTFTPLSSAPQSWFHLRTWTRRSTC